MAINIRQTGTTWIITMTEKWTMVRQEGNELIKEFLKNKIPFNIRYGDEGTIIFDMNSVNIKFDNYFEMKGALETLLDYKEKYVSGPLLTGLKSEKEFPAIL